MKRERPSVRRGTKISRKPATPELRKLLIVDRAAVEIEDVIRRRFHRAKIEIPRPDDLIWRCRLFINGVYEEGKKTGLWNDD